MKLVDACFWFTCMLLQTIMISWGTKIGQVKTLDSFWRGRSWKPDTGRHHLSCPKLVTAPPTNWGGSAEHSKQASQPTNIHLPRDLCLLISVPTLILLQTVIVNHKRRRSAQICVRHGLLTMPWCLSCPYTPSHPHVLH